MDILYKDREVIIKDMKYFVPKHTFECGQCFRWNEEADGSYTGVVYKKIINVVKQDNNLIIRNTTKNEFEKYWVQYFDLERNYSEIIEVLSKDNILMEAIKFGEGIRILNQEPWETLISYIVSTNKRIPMIKKIIEDISINHGKYIGEYNGNKYYSFPDVFDLEVLDEEEIRECKMGFRAKYIKAACEKVFKNEYWLESLKKLSSEQAGKELKTIKGVGDKVAHCVMLFSLGMYDSFPVDVWVRRIMTELYCECTTDESIKKYKEKYFGKYAGFAQQYLFYYARENNIGKNN